MTPTLKKYTFSVVVIAVLGSAAFKLWGMYSLPDFSDYEAGQERKAAFFDHFLPIVLEQNKRIQTQRQELKDLHSQMEDLSWWAEYKLSNLAKRYKLKDFDNSSDKEWIELIKRVDTIPVSLALAQAANESAWGTSRFAREGHNYFGQWCYEKGCGLVPKKRGKGETHEVAYFSNADESVASYMANLNSHRSYSTLRNIRYGLRAKDQKVTGSSLLPGLKHYSTRGDLYTNELNIMIRQNKLGQYD